MVTAVFLHQSTLKVPHYHHTKCSCPKWWANFLAATPFFTRTEKSTFYPKDFSGVVGTQNDRLDLLSPNKFSLGKFDKAFPRYGPVYEFCGRNLKKKSKAHIFGSIYLYLYVKEAQFNADQHKIGPVRIGQIPTRLSQKNWFARGRFWAFLEICHQAVLKFFQWVHQHCMTFLSSTQQSLLKSDKK